MTRKKKIEDHNIGEYCDDLVLISAYWLEFSNSDQGST